MLNWPHVGTSKVRFMGMWINDTLLGGFWIHECQTKVATSPPYHRPQTCSCFPRFRLFHLPRYIAGYIEFYHHWRGIQLEMSHASGLSARDASMTTGHNDPTGATINDKLLIFDTFYCIFVNDPQMVWPCLTFDSSVIACVCPHVWAPGERKIINKANFDMLCWQNCPCNHMIVCTNCTTSLHHFTSCLTFKDAFYHVVWKEAANCQINYHNDSLLMIHHLTMIFCISSLFLLCQSSAKRVFAVSVTVHFFASVFCLAQNETVENIGMKTIGNV